MPPHEVPMAWFIVSFVALSSGILAYVVSLGIMGQIARLVLPLLDETRDQIQDLGDLAANTVGRASESMDLVELRVTQAMGQAAQGSAAATQQAMGVGSVLAGIYVVSRLAALFRGHRPKRRR